VDLLFFVFFVAGGCPALLLPAACMLANLYLPYAHARSRTLPNISFSFPMLFPYFLFSAFHQLSKQKMLVE
jgi:hypothetical protein